MALRRIVVAMMLALPLAACGGDDLAKVPHGVSFQVEQARQDLPGRNIQLRVVNEGSSPVTVTRAELGSKRFDGQATYRGPATIQQGSKTNLTVEMPIADCGKGIGMTATVHYRVGEGEERTSVVQPKDHYGSVALAMAVTARRTQSASSRSTRSSRSSGRAGTRSSRSV